MRWNWSRRMEVQETLWWGVWPVCVEVVENSPPFAKFPTMQFEAWSDAGHRTWTCRCLSMKLLIETRVSSHLTWKILSWHGMRLPFTAQALPCWRFPIRTQRGTSQPWVVMIKHAQGHKNTMPQTTGRCRWMKKRSWSLFAVDYRSASRSQRFRTWNRTLVVPNKPHSQNSIAETFWKSVQQGRCRKYFDISDIIVFCVVPSPYSNKAPDGVKDVKVATRSIPNTNSSPSALVWKPSGESIEAYSMLNQTYTS